MTHTENEQPVTIWVRAYDERGGVSTRWDDGSVLRAEVFDQPEPMVVLSGNRAGLRSLARHLLTLSQVDVPGGRHFDFDSYIGELDEGSLSLRVEIDP
jgi:hypothetical protein